MKNRRIILVAFLSLAATAAHAAHKVIFFISPPRSLSTAFLRMMYERKDFSIMHEQSQWAWHKSAGRDFAAQWFITKGEKVRQNANVGGNPFSEEAVETNNQKEVAPATYAEFKRRIFKRAEKENVFVKEISWSVHKFLLDDTELLSNPNVYFVFLLRFPHPCLISMYKKLGDIEHIYPVHNLPFDYMVGYQASYAIFEHLKQHGIRKPLIICAEHLYEKTEETIRQFCDYAGIPFKPESLHWQKLGNNINLQQEWGEIKGQASSQYWNGVAIASSGFTKPTEYKVDALGVPTFEEIQQKHKTICLNAYHKNMEYYQLMMQDRIS